MLGVSDGMMKVASATCGLPFRFSHDSSYAFQISTPKNGTGLPSGRPISVRLGWRGIGNSSEASYSVL
ncbi:hypothetical protein D3C81_1215600 [compost metagenome]